MIHKCVEITVRQVHRFDSLTSITYNYMVIGFRHREVNVTFVLHKLAVTKFSVLSTKHYEIESRLGRS